MNFLSSIILGIVQGITEFLPISSTGHLIIVRSFLGENFDYGLAFDAVLQLATTFAILIYFRKDILSILKNWKMMKIIALATVPALIFGVFVEKFMDTVFRSAVVVIFGLLLGSLIMYLAEKFYESKSEIGTKSGFWVGCFQVLALLPGMSRSGMTISGGLFQKFSREMAVRFSFWLSIPILLISGAKKMLDIFQGGLINQIGSELLVGSIFSFIFGLLSIHFLISFLKTKTLKPFIWYRVVLVIILVVLSILDPVLLK